MILSIPEHISNVHTFPANSHHKKCDHLPLTGERSKAWLVKNAMVFLQSCYNCFWELIDIFQEVQKIRSALLGKDNCRINDVPHMVGFTHTGSIGKIIFSFNYFSLLISPSLECWNSLHNHYANKNYFYRYF